MPTQMSAGAVVYAIDVKRLAAFYAGVTGLRQTQSDPDAIILEAGGFQLVVHSIPPHIAGQIQIATPPQRRKDTPIKLVFAIDSLPAARAAATALGGGLDPEEKVWEFQGWLVCDGHDPEGNIIQVRVCVLR